VPGKTTEVYFSTGTGSVFADYAGFFGGANKVEGALVKQGSGNLVLDFLPPAGAVRVEEGRVIVRNPKPRLAHRWSFNGDLADSVTGESAVIDGTGGMAAAWDDEASPTALSIPGGARGTCAIDLGLNRLPSNAVTIECWVTSDAGNEEWTKVVNIGTSSGAAFAVSFSQGAGQSFGIVARRDGAYVLYNVAGGVTLAEGKQYYMATTFTPDGAGNTRVGIWVFDAATGTLLASGIDQVAASWTLPLLEGQNLFLGRSGWNNPDAKATYDEVRIWEGTFAKGELAAHAVLGPDVLPGGEKDLGNVLAKIQPSLAHRWSFNGDLADSVTGESAVIDGTGGLAATAWDDEASPAALSLPGGARGTCAIDLGRNRLPSNVVTIECWVTPDVGNEAWTKVVNIGTSPGAVFAASFSQGAGQSFGIAARRSGADILKNVAGGVTLQEGTQYYIATTFTPDGAGNTRVGTWVFDAATGALLSSGIDQVAASWTLSLLEGQNLFLGRSGWTNNSDAKATYDEVRIWSGVFTRDELAAHAVLGPDALPDDEIPSALSAYPLGDEMRLLHRWSFNGTIADVAGGATTNDATLVGAADYNAAGTAVRLPGGARGTAWVNLGGNFLPTSLGESPFTVELWTTLLGTANWTQAFTLGSPKTPDGSGGATGILLAFRNDSGRPTVNPIQSAVSNTEIASSALAANTEYHVALSVTPAGNGKGADMKWYIFKPDGTVFTEKSMTLADWTTESIVQSVFWLGHSMWNNPDAGAEYNEVRVWGAALTKEQLMVNGGLGPDVLPASLATAAGETRRESPDAVDVAAGGTVDLSGGALEQKNLSGSGVVGNGTLSVTGVLSPGGTGAAGTLTLDVESAALAGTLLLDAGDRVAAAGTLDLTAAEIAVNVPAGAHVPSILFATSAVEGGIVGQAASVPRGVMMRIAPDGRSARLGKLGLMVFVR